MLICLCFLIVGNLLYAIYPPPWLLLLSRIIVGIGAGTLGQSRGYVSQVTTKEQRTRFMAYLTVSQFAGFAVTPGISILLSMLDFDLFGVATLEADGYTSAGYLLFALAILSIVLVFVFFVDPPRAVPKPVPKKESKSIAARINSAATSLLALARRPDFKKIVLFAGLIFATRTAVAVVETSSSGISSTLFQWTSQTLSYFLCGLGVLGTGILIALPSVCKRLGAIGEGLLLCVGVFSLAFGMILMIPFFANAELNKYTFVVGLGFAWGLGSALCQTLIISFLSLIISQESQGAVMGMLASLGSVARIVGAVWAGFALSSSAGIVLTLTVPASIMLLCLTGTVMLVVNMHRASQSRKL